MAEQQEETSLREAMDEAASELDNRDSGSDSEPKARKERSDKGSRREAKTLADQVRDTPDPTDTPQTPWEAPGWAKAWKEPSRKALEALASMQGAGDHLKALTGELDQTYSYVGRRDQELAGLHKRFGPVADVLAQAEHQFTMQGQSLQQGLGQLMAVSQSLANNPDQTLPWLGQLYKPRDPGAVIQALSQAWGADLGQVAQGAPYVDPAIQGLVAPLLNRLNSIEQATFQQQQQAQYQQQDRVLSEIGAFENAVDESGNARHPFFREVFQDMVTLAQMGRARNVQEAYELATRYHPGAQESKAKQAEKSALAQAARTTATAKQASDASRNINSSARGNRDMGHPTLLEAMKAADKQLGL